MRRWPGVIGGSVAMAALACTGAAAATVKRDRIVFQGTGSYSARYVTTTRETFAVSASFRFRTVFPRALFSRGGAGGENLASLSDSSYSGSWKASVTQPGRHVLCSGAGRFGNPGHGTPPVLLKYRWSSDTARVSIHAYALPSDALPSTNRQAGDCYPALLPNAGLAALGFWRDWIEGFSNIGGRQHDSLSTRFEVPDSALTSDRAIETLTPPPDQSTPGFCTTGKFKTCTQAYGWSGSITFTKLG